MHPDVRREWAIVVAAWVFSAGVFVWLAVTSQWILLAAVAALSVLCALVAWREGLPLWPGRPPRTRTPRS